MTPTNTKPARAGDAAGLGTNHAWQLDGSENTAHRDDVQRFRDDGALKAALVLADEGKAVFFCAWDKHPTTPHGFKNATRDPAAVRELYRRHPGPLIGVPTGDASGVDALDVDLQHASAKAWWEAHRGRMPATRAHRTRSGGLHLLFLHVAGVRCSAGKIARGIDTRGDGGYVIWWPAQGFEIPSCGPMAAWPSWLLDLLFPKPAPKRATRLDREYRFDERSLAGLARKVAMTPVGQRNSVLFWAACRAGEAISAGLLAESFAVDVLLDAAARAGLLPNEARPTILGGISRGGESS